MQRSSLSAMYILPLVSQMIDHASCADKQGGVVAKRILHTFGEKDCEVRLQMSGWQ